MDAVISGRAGRAIVLDDGFVLSLNPNNLLSLDPDNLDKFLLCRPADLQVLRDAEDAIVVKDANIETILQKLLFEWDSAYVFDLIQMSLNPRTAKEARSGAVQILDELLTDADAARRLESILYGRPLADEADLFGAIACCYDAGARTVQTLLETLAENQPQIRKVCSAWESIPDAVFNNDLLKSEFHDFAIREGLFLDLSLCCKNEPEVFRFLLRVLRNETVREIQNHREVLLRWIAPLRKDAGLRMSTPVIKWEPVEKLSEEDRRARKRIKPTRRQRGEVRFEKVIAQKELIIEVMRRGDLPRVHKLLDELIDFHLRTSNPKYLVKSLCSLAMEAKALGNFALQVELTRRSVEIKPDDAWSWRQYGDALVNVGRFDEAVKAFAESEIFGHGVIAKLRRAHVLKVHGSLTAALHVYQEILDIYPRNIVARNGRAAVLGAQGELAAALNAYEENIALRPQNVAARIGRAEVLKAKGDFAGALYAYDETIALRPDNIVARTGRAEVLKAQGDLRAALSAYDEILAWRPENAVAQEGRSSVLAALRRYMSRTRKCLTLSERISDL